MSDRAAFWIRIYACPDNAEAVLSAFEFEGLTVEWGQGFTDELELGTEYTDDERSIGSDAELVNTIIGLDPNSIFEAAMDPKYEWDGTYYAYVPGLGLFEANASSNGEPHWTKPKIDEIFKLDEAGRAKALGEPWEAVIKPLREAAGEFNPMTYGVSHPALYPSGYQHTAHTPGVVDHFVPEGWEDLDVGVCPCGELVRWDAPNDRWVIDRTLVVLVLENADAKEIADEMRIRMAENPGEPEFVELSHQLDRQLELNKEFDEETA